YKINGLGADEFPPVLPLKDDKKITLSQEKFRGMLRKTSFAISSDESRYVLNGIFISLKEHKITLVATDGRRLALVDEEVDIPETSKGEIEICFTENQASFTLKDDKGFSILIISKLVEGNYPNYRQVIPSETKER